MERIRLAVLIFTLCFAATVPAFAAPPRITFWTTEVEKDRLDIQQDLARLLAARHGIEVKVVPVEENLLQERVTAAYAARSLPDVIYHPIDYSVGWVEAGILDAQAAADVVQDLGKETFGKGPLKLASVSGGYAGVPIDGWGQLLLYRKDLFDSKGLSPPDSWEHILDAARTLHNPPLIWGFEAPTDPSQTYTQQVFEHIALSNGVRLTDTSGKVRLNTPEMVQVLEYYRSLARFSPPGNLYWLHTRMDYLSGRAAMIIWSPFILDELSGLRQDQPVVPDIARGKPGFLARNTGFITVLRGPKGSAQYGQINYLGITRDADREAAKAWARYLLTDGYLPWLTMAPEGKLPLRRGNAKEPNRFIDGWMDLEFGVTTRARISQFYGMDVAKAIIAGVEEFDRWGFAEGKGSLVSKIYGTKLIPEILKKFLDGELDAGQAARDLDERVRALD
ncbi:MAG: extracellular solute-binding protein, partial [Deltaproteobacteria bacterium]|nr:extracellular solute-binding protein [Deltaproteobacteria bacterium]